MSAKPAPSPDFSETPPAENAPRVRRISNPRPKKPAREAAEPTAAADPPVSASPPEVTASQTARTDWPEPEAASTGAPGQTEHAKRKRRRKKGKGHNPQIPVGSQDEDSFTPTVGEPAEAATTPAQPTGQPSSHPSHAPRVKIDPEVLATRAWKIYLSEVSEEGVALVGDNDAKDLARRCFRLAEIFLEEQGRRR